MSNRYHRKMLSSAKAKPRATLTPAAVQPKSAKRLSRLEMRALGLLDAKNNPVVL